jgi:hypothetical protein
MMIEVKDGIEKSTIVKDGIKGCELEWKKVFPG